MPALGAAGAANHTPLFAGDEGGDLRARANAELDEDRGEMLLDRDRSHASAKIRRVSSDGGARRSRRAAALQSNGFVLFRQRGSHRTHGHPDGRRTQIPMHAG